MGNVSTLPKNVHEIFSPVKCSFFHMSHIFLICVELILKAFSNQRDFNKTYTNEHCRSVSEDPRSDSYEYFLVSASALKAEATARAVPIFIRTREKIDSDTHVTGPPMCSIAP